MEQEPKLLLHVLLQLSTISKSWLPPPRLVPLLEFLAGIAYLWQKRLIVPAENTEWRRKT